MNTATTSLSEKEMQDLYVAVLTETTLRQINYLNPHLNVRERRLNILTLYQPTVDSVMGIVWREWPDRTHQNVLNIFQSIVDRLWERTDSLDFEGTPKKTLLDQINSVAIDACDDVLEELIKIASSDPKHLALVCAGITAGWRREAVRKGQDDDWLAEEVLPDMVTIAGYTCAALGIIEEEGEYVNWRAPTLAVEVGARLEQQMDMADTDLNELCVKDIYDLVWAQLKAYEQQEQDEQEGRTTDNSLDQDTTTPAHRPLMYLSSPKGPTHPDQ